MNLRQLTTIPAVLALCICSTAQVVHVVQMGGSTVSQTAPFYAPMDITINEGDTVRWVNVSGTHNVNGSVVTFPGNPEGFFSGLPENGSYHWDHAFDIAGLYNYHCDSQGHAATQFGSINVVAAGNAIQEARIESPISIHPNPVGSTLYVGVGQRVITGVSILGVDGRLIASPEVKGSGMLMIGTEELATGNYILQLHAASGSQNIPFSKQ